MDIISYLNKKGLDTVDSAFYRRIEEWKSWYRGNVKSFSFYRVYTGQGTYTRRKRKSLGMAKKVCEDIANLLLNEKVKITLSNKKTENYIKQILKQNKFDIKGNEYQERKACTGTVAYIPYLDNVEYDEETGAVLSGMIGINYASAAEIFPLSWHNGQITECAFAFVKTIERRKYVHLQFHMLEHGEYVINNEVVECISGSRHGRKLGPEEWKHLKGFSNMVETVKTGSDRPQYVIDRLNTVNNADDDESNPMGIALFANSIDVLKKIDTEFDSYCNEFDLGKKRIFVAPEMLKNTDGSLAFDPEDTVFYKMPDDYNEKGEGMIHEVNMDIRSEEHSKAINDDLNYLSSKCGFGTDRYRFESGNLKTATEVISENSDMFRNLKKHEIILCESLKELIGIIIRLGNALGEQLDENTEITIDFDDSIIEDKTAERQQDRQDVAMGAMPLYEYRAKYYGETIEEAKRIVQSKEELIE